MKKFQKLFCYLICLALAAGLLSSSALAAPPVEQPNTENSEDTTKTLGDIPVYIDFTSSLTRSPEPTVSTSIQVKTDEQHLLFEHDLFAQTMQKAQSIIDSGGTVKAVHFLLPKTTESEQLTLTSVLASNDWRANTYFLRYYNTYEFRYVDSYIDGETGYINVTNLGTIKWKDMVTTGLKAVVNNLIEGKIGTPFSVAIALKDVISAGKVDPNITYSYGSQSYVKYNALFRHYLRTIYIGDKDNIIPGYDYYICGSAERAEVDNHVLTRWPNDSHSWTSSSGKAGSQALTTAGFNGSASVLPKCIESYKLQRKYTESIELKKELIKILKK